MSDAMSDASEEEEGQGDQQEPTMEEILASIRRIISEDGEPADEEGAEPAESEATGESEPEPEPESEPEPEPEPEPDPEAEEDILELTDVVADEEPAEDEEISVVDEVEAEPEPEPAAQPEPAPLAAAADTYTTEGLVSPTTADATTGAFAGMTSALYETRGLPLGNNQTLEGIVKELLRPMLKDWLDENLAPMVQRIVEREVTKLAGRAEEDDINS